MNTQIKQACDAFQKLLEEQLARAERIANEQGTDSKSEKTVIGLIDGDGIGPIIM